MGPKRLPLAESQAPGAGSRDGFCQELKLRVSRLLALFVRTEQELLLLWANIYAACVPAVLRMLTATFRTGTCWKYKKEQLEERALNVDQFQLVAPSKALEHLSG
ncbi:hypothetical protein XENOCAPTIV_021603 [Xenoophorus captivus]|uniref:Uncharacterized protein n=1 Tax=Xenoophorus captivus TaxID=1517983 RepID=A0ABV0QJJ5_9TELE